MNNKSILVVIPARGGSKGIPRKNIRFLAGKPLISYSIINALKSKYCLDIVVSSDDDEIKRISSLFGASIIDRPNELSTDSITLDPVIYHAVLKMENINNKTYDLVITMQPTSPLLNTSTLDNAIEYCIKEDFDTVISGVNQPHLAWTQENGKYIPKYTERLNRQYLPKHLLETGAFFISKRECVTESSRFGSNVSIFETTVSEAIDIDNAQDWWVAEKELMKKKIIIRTEGYSKIGLGHIYRSLLLAYNMIDHEVKLVVSSKSDIGIERLKNSHFDYEIIEDNDDIFKLIQTYECDIIINDILDTDVEYMKRLKLAGVRVINFEDLGEGADHADAVINALYEKQKEGKNYYWGSDYYCIRDEFLLAHPKQLEEKATEVLVLFGGTDPSNLTERVLKVISKLPIEFNINYTIILGMGYEKENDIRDYAAKMNIKNIDIIKDVKLMTDYMSKADIAISSQGRTMFELASMAVPTILLAQNNRELHHEFGYLQNGFINLGLGAEVEDKTIRETIIWLVNSPQIRYQMRKKMLSLDLKNGIKRVMSLIFNTEE